MSFYDPLLSKWMFHGVPRQYLWRSMKKSSPWCMALFFSPQTWKSPKWRFQRRAKTAEEKDFVRISALGMMATGLVEFMDLLKGFPAKNDEKTRMVKIEDIMDISIREDGIVFFSPWNIPLQPHTTVFMVVQFKIPSSNHHSSGN